MPSDGVLGLAGPSGSAGAALAVGSPEALPPLLAAVAGPLVEPFVCSLEGTTTTGLCTEPAAGVAEATATLGLTGISGAIEVGVTAATDTGSGGNSSSFFLKRLQPPSISKNPQASSRLIVVPSSMSSGVVWQNMLRSLRGKAYGPE